MPEKIIKRYFIVKNISYTLIEANSEEEALNKFSERNIELRSSQNCILPTAIQSDDKWTAFTLAQQALSKGWGR